MELPQISKPLEDLLGSYGFIQEEVMMDGAIRMISFKHPEGKRVEYMIHILRHKEKGRFDSDSEIDLSVRLYTGEQPIELFEHGTSGSNMPMADLIEGIRVDYIEPGLQKYLIQ